jgi:hypothetical protein
VLTAEGRVETDRPHRYLAQLREHVTKMGEQSGHRPRAHGHTPPEIQHIEWSDDEGVVTLNLGQWTMRATPEALTLHLAAACEDNLRRLQDLVSKRVETIGRRDGLTVAWDAPADPKPKGWSRTGGWLLAAIVAVAVIAHLTLGSAALTVSGWAAVGLIAVAVLVKVVALHLFTRRRRTKDIRS